VITSFDPRSPGLRRDSSLLGSGPYTAFRRTGQHFVVRGREATFRRISIVIAVFIRSSARLSVERRTLTAPHDLNAEDLDVEDLSAELVPGVG
jgi:hypothetical protein